MSIAAQYPARTDTLGRTWWRPVRPAGTDLSQWGWTSDPAQAHPDYDALNTCTCPYVDPSLWTTHYGAVEPGSAQEHNPLCPVHPATLVDLVVAREAPVVAAAAERAEVFGDAWAQVFELAGGGRAIVPIDPPPVEPLGELGDEWVQLGYVDETQGGLW
ncbi:hypothetical protein SEA_DEBY_80 [Mycobacterium phage Deby]|uniref:Uncharacterized protein n=1 Tax=Mycobacterium phage Deby TaxID=2094130 RepID=A0A2P1JWZ3_9CAUD|nr:hypothetical protein SEA_DEBY_80 [Mycobacterium phage Deby]